MKFNVVLCTMLILFVLNFDRVAMASHNLKFKEKNKNPMNDYFKDYSHFAETLVGGNK